MRCPGAALVPIDGTGLEQVAATMVAVGPDWELTQSAPVVIRGFRPCSARSVARKHRTKSGTASHVA
jgi:hypothetical protein